MSELRDEEDRVTYESGFPDQTDTLKREEDIKEEQSRGMLRELVIIPPKEGPQPPPNVPGPH
ncbi:MAG: hypothetical protein AB2L11_12100 [Syntrophobacteraceae bacterium]